jgi:hypothetical protein
MRSVADPQPQRVMAWRQRYARSGIVYASMVVVPSGSVRRSAARSASVKCLRCGNIRHVICPKQGKLRRARGAAICVTHRSDLVAMLLQIRRCDSHENS